VSGGQLIQSLAFHPDHLSSGAGSRYRNWLATAASEPAIHLWDLGPHLGGDSLQPTVLVTPTAVLEAHLLRQAARFFSTLLHGLDEHLVTECSLAYELPVCCLVSSLSLGSSLLRVISNSKTYI
jgi:hypothetical protein